MGAGYIYILTNDSYKGLIKIGSTTLGAQERAKQLSSNTAVPTPFRVAYEVYVDDYLNFEKELHEKLCEFRVNPNREFFNYPLNKAIKLIDSLKDFDKYQNEDKFEAIEILPQILQRYGENIDNQISSMRIFQNNDRVYFEFTKDEYISEYLKNQYITRVDLAFIIEDVDENDLLFKSQAPININVKKFLELDDISMANCVGEIFTDDWIPD